MIGKGKTRHSRRALAGIAVAGLAGAGHLMLVTPGLADTVFGCAFSATVGYAPTGPGAGGAFNWTMQGQLQGCISTAAGTPQAGVVTVGEPLTVSVPITLGNGKVVQGTAQYQEPLGSSVSTAPGVNSCASAILFSPAVFFSWSDGTITEANINILTVGPIFEPDGFATNGANLPLIAGSEMPKGTAPGRYTVFSNNPSIAQIEPYTAVAAVTRTDALDCTTTSGVQSADIAGALEFGDVPTTPR